MGKCHFCGAQVTQSVYRNTECPSCHRSLHCCVCCHYYSPGSHFDCHEDVDENIVDKERANFCDSFKLSDKEPKKTEKKDLSALEALFSL